VLTHAAPPGWPLVFFADAPAKNGAVTRVVIGGRPASCPHDIEVISISCKAGSGRLVIDVAIPKNRMQGVS
jgi:hypothetical protein